MSFDKTKHTTIITLFKQGRTLREIGHLHSITGERVRQILTRHGVSSQDGGRTVRTSKKKVAISKSREAACMEKHGCTIEQYMAVCGHHSQGAKSASLAFIRQRNHARSRGVEWNLKFWDWYSIWQESGKWEERGRGVNGYCMCRNGDEGAYEPANVYIGTVVHNSTLGRTLAHERSIERSDMHRAIRAAGGRKVVSEALNTPRAYLSQLANDGYMPRSWLDDGRASILADLTCGTYSLDAITCLCRSPSEKEVA